MQKIVTSIFLLFLALAVSAQTVTQQGVTYRYNGKKPHTPIGNVYLKTPMSPNAILSDSASGAFTFHLKGLQMGSPITNVTAKKKGMIVFNKQAVDEWSVRKEPLALVLCDAEEFEKQKRNLIAIGEREAKKKYDKMIADIEAKYKQESLEWFQKMSEADSMLQDVKRHIGEYADLLARIDESQIDTTAQRALELFRNGKIEEAINTFEEGHFMEKLEQDIKAERQAVHLIKIAQEGKEKARKAREEHIRNIYAQIEAYKVQGSWQKAADLLKGLADNLNIPHNFFEYAYFCNSKGVNVNDVEPYYQKVLDATFESKHTNANHLYLYATALGNLGIIYEQKGLIEKAEEAIKKSIEGRRQYAEITNVQNDKNHIAWSLVTLGDFYTNHSRFEEAETCLKGAEDIYNSIANTYHEGNNFFSYGRLYDKIGWLNLKKNRQDLSDEYYNKAWSELVKGASYNPKECSGLMAHILRYGFCELFKAMGVLPECEKYYIELDSIITHHYNENAKDYEIAYATFLDDEAAFYFDIGLFEKCDLTGRRYLPIYRTLAQRNPQEYMDDLATALYNMGLACLNHSNTEDALGFLEEAKGIRRQLSLYFPDAEDLYMSTLFLIVECFIQSKDFENLFTVSLELETLLKKKYEATPEDTVLCGNYAITLSNLSHGMILKKDFPKAERYAQEALKVDSTNAAKALGNLFIALLFQGKVDDAENICQQLTDIQINDIIEDFDYFTQKGVIPKEQEADVERIMKLLTK